MNAALHHLNHGHRQRDHNEVVADLLTGADSLASLFAGMHATGERNPRDLIGAANTVTGMARLISELRMIALAEATGGRHDAA